MYWISSQILCHTHTDTAEGEDFENQSKQEIMRGERVLHERTDWPVKQRISTWPQKPPKTLNSIMDWPFGAPSAKPGMINNAQCLLVRVCLCVWHVHDNMRGRDGGEQEWALSCLTLWAITLSCSWTVHPSLLFLSLSFNGYIKIEPGMQKNPKNDLGPTVEKSKPL